MTLPKAVKAKLNARKEEYEYNAETLNQKIAFATMTYHTGLPLLGAGTTTHAREFLVFKDLSDLLITIKTDYKLYDVEPQYTRNRDGVFRICLIKAESQQSKELEKIESDIKREYKQSLALIKETVINEILDELAAEKFAVEEEKRLSKLDKEHNDLKQALFNAA